MTYIAKVDKVKVTTVECIIRNARIINVKDRNGLNVGEEDAKTVPSIVILAVNEEQVDLLRKAEEIGELDLYAPRSVYNDHEESVFNEESSLLGVLRNE